MSFEEISSNHFISCINQYVADGRNLRLVSKRAHDLRRLYILYIKQRLYADKQMGNSQLMLKNYWFYPELWPLIGESKKNIFVEGAKNNIWLYELLPPKRNDRIEYLIPGLMLASKNNYVHTLNESMSDDIKFLPHAILAGAAEAGDLERYKTLLQEYISDVLPEGVPLIHTSSQIIESIKRATLYHAGMSGSVEMIEYAKSQLESSEDNCYILIRGIASGGHVDLTFKYLKMYPSLHISIYRMALANGFFELADAILDKYSFTVTNFLQHMLEAAVGCGDKRRVLMYVKMGARVTKDIIKVCRKNGHLDLEIFLRTLKHNF
jgi:hypothetical protein